MVDWCDKEPNPAHKALAALNIPIITQNVDGLHEKSGAKEVYAMHGTLKTVHCINCKRKQNSSELAARLRPLYQRGDKEAIFEALRCPHCGGAIDVDVVLYGDGVHHLEEAMDLSRQADLMLVIGTSLVTYPAAMLPKIARANGAKIVMINEDCVGELEGILK
jgi:NAD-dependent deacetylase